MASSLTGAWQPLVGQVGNLRPVVNRPCAGPGKLFRAGRKAGFHRIPPDIPRDPLKLIFITHQAVMALVLPKRFSRAIEDSVGFSRRESLEGMGQLRNRHIRGDQQIDVIRHDYPGMNLAAAQRNGLVVDGVHNQARHLRDAKPGGPRPCFVEKPVHSNESFARSEIRRKAATLGQSARKSPGEEHRLTGGVPVRQSPRMKTAHVSKVLPRGRNSPDGGRLTTGRRFPTCPTMQHSRNRRHGAPCPASRQL
jgi:hypothetical protein